jgi:quinol monooxygenase YgiN
VGRIDEEENHLPMANPDVTPVFVITHIDIIPTNMEAGRELLLRYAAEVRDEPGLTRFELLSQLRRPNHFETLAVWESETHYVESLGAPVTLAYRERLHPLLGSPFDDRMHVLEDESPPRGEATPRE